MRVELPEIVESFSNERSESVSWDNGRLCFTQRLNVDLKRRKTVIIYGWGGGFIDKYTNDVDVLEIPNILHLALDQFEENPALNALAYFPNENTRIAII